MIYEQCGSRAASNDCDASTDTGCVQSSIQRGMRSIYSWIGLCTLGRKLIMTIFEKISNRIATYYLLFIKRDPYIVSVYRWRKDNPDSTLRVDYPLSESSIVLDVGGYKGEWSQEIVRRHDPYIYIFEPVPQFYSLIVDKFRQSPKVSVFNFGLYDTTKTEKISVNNDSSSTCRITSNHITEIVLEDIYSFLSVYNIESIDLIKINIEGGEYALLRRMLDTKIVDRCQDIQVQFHNFFPDAKELRNEIRASLSKTHFITYDYPFVWENWRKR